MVCKRLVFKRPPNVRVEVRAYWLERAAAQPGKALHVAVALLWLASQEKQAEVILGRKTMARFAMSRDACYEGLNRLEAAGLIGMERRVGRTPLITVGGVVVAAAS